MDNLILDPKQFSTGRDLMVGSVRIGRDEITWFMAGDEGNPKARLLASMNILGTWHHLEAYQVDLDDDGTAAPVEGSFLRPEDLDALYKAFSPSGPFKLVAIEDKEYILFLYPFS